MAGDPAMTLAADVRAQVGDFTLAVSLDAADGEVLALVGPNGAGKSTLLRALAGLMPATGPVRVDGRDLSGLPAERRGIGWVPQAGALFPHLSALDNVAFGLGGRRGRAVARTWLSRLGLESLASRKPSQLSGGQAQKVALARALARDPRLLLLDEPLTALDVAARLDVRRTLREHLAGFAGVTVLVTHDAVDAAAFADRVVAVDRGRVVQDDTPGVVTRAPRTAWLAQLMGANAFAGRTAGATLVLEDGGVLALAEPAGDDDLAALGVVPAHGVSLHRSRPRGSARNAWPVVVRELATAGSRVRVHCDGAPPVVAEVTTSAVADLGLREDDEVWASVKATEVTVVLL
ncbi:MAG TPA: ABC transporter ATP-binding protein [Mycobacteriales bacterium]|nr:ABC transporter ATP-binding protein [Mycobacteriales bacterium]